MEPNFFYRNRNCKFRKCIAELKNHHQYFAPWGGSHESVEKNYEASNVQESLQENSVILVDNSNYYLHNIVLDNQTYEFF